MRNSLFGFSIVLLSMWATVSFAQSPPGGGGGAGSTPLSEPLLTSYIYHAYMYHFPDSARLRVHGKAIYDHESNSPASYVLKADLTVTLDDVHLLAPELGTLSGAQGFDEMETIYGFQIPRIAIPVDLVKEVIAEPDVLLDDVMLTIPATFGAGLTDVRAQEVDGPNQRKHLRSQIWVQGESNTVRGEWKVEIYNFTNHHWTEIGNRFINQDVCESYCVTFDEPQYSGHMSPYDEFKVRLSTRTLSGTYQVKETKVIKVLK